MKTITVKQALEQVQSGCHIASALGAAEGQGFLSELHTVAERVRGTAQFPGDSASCITVTSCLSLRSYPYLEPAYRETFLTENIFFSPPTRAAYSAGNVSYIPCHLRLCGVNRLAHTKPNIFIGTATPPDKHGFVSLGVSNSYEKRMLQQADIVILEINPHYPRTFGDLEVHISAVDYCIEADYPVPTLPDAPVTENDKIIGKLIADYIQDGDCLQFGIGGIPNAVAEALAGKKDLGIHTEMLSTGLVKLVKSGVVTNARKTKFPGKTIATFALGTREVYDYIHDNPSVLLFDANYVNDPYVIARNDNQVSINTTIEIDLTGQCCSESIGPRQYSGTGGQVDTVTGAQKARNGRSFIALYSTAMVKTAEGGHKARISKIVPSLKLGATVSLQRNDVDYVVTEYGVVNLKGTSIKERAKRLISIAHPEYREELTAAARELML
ncbi:MAG: 4-hydroxybutyrate--acetyl-CoA CoA transferase [Defluviitaleaceae bacterium]|nr:4-hydroxybutyrate--acetyl-CoA CoA transferase [Defluviitaleaceae bacterium]MCL2239756.1 4-hydroxybutyrate--acetyl-CoA CoA transferase [Defluviitaleaceae bacterium]